MAPTPLSLVGTFDPNDGDNSKPPGLPVIKEATTVEQYADFFLNSVPTAFKVWCDSEANQLNAHRNALSTGSAMMAKAITLPPEMQSFARFSLMPESYNGGVLQWPGIPPEALRKIARENLAPLTIINMRTDDVLRYSVQSSHPWKPGWRIRMRHGLDEPSAATKDDIKEASKFIENCNLEYDNARLRDARGLRDFSTFLAELTRDSLTYDGMAIWTDMDLSGRIKAFKTLSSFNIRLCVPGGYNGNPEEYAVGVDDANNVVHVFTRDQLIFKHRNPRSDADIGGYGFPEIEQGVRLVQGFQNALDLNADIFTRSSTPNGFLLAKGMGNQKQIDILSRIWVNLKRGTSKAWALPVIPVPKDGDIEVRDLSTLKGMDLYYENYINMIAGLFCAMYRFPVRRLGFHISGKSRDNAPAEQSTQPAGVEDFDPYLGVLLQHIENIINHYIIWTRWPGLSFQFCGSNPKEDARAYEATVLACTADERRALSDQPKLVDTIEGGNAKQKEMAEIMGLAPVDPGLAGVYQAAVAAVYGKDAEEGAGPEARMESKRDPAKSEEHGHTSGVRRDSKAEAASAAKS